MKIKLKICSGCNQPKVIWKNVAGEKFCRECYGRSRTGVAKAPKPNVKRIPSRSSKKQKLDLVYTVARNRFLVAHPLCHARIDARCTQKATEVHHKAGRIAELYLDELYWLPVCHDCHVWCEMHPQEAKALGLSVDRLTVKKEQ